MNLFYKSITLQLWDLKRKKDELHLIDQEKRMLPCYSPMQQDVEDFEWGKGTGPSACIVLDN